MSEEPIDLMASPRFNAGFERASPGLQRLAYQEVRALQRRLAADRAIGFQTYGGVRGLGTSTVRELELGGGPRILAHYQAGVATLLAIGDHEVTAGYDRRKLADDMAKASPANERFLPDLRLDTDSIFGSDPSPKASVFGTELTPEWIYFLADPQNAFVKSTIRAFGRANANNPSFRFAVGGPGTGKTSILLKIFVELRATGAHPAFILTQGVADYIETCSGVKLGDDWVPVNDWILGNRSLEPFDAVLFDDPSSAELIEAALTEITGSARMGVIGFDPFQLSSDLTDDEYADLIEKCSAEVREFRVCYRQKEAVGRATRRAMDAIAKATPYLALEKVNSFQIEHGRLGRIANSARFPNPHGYVETYAPAREADVRREARRIRQAPQWAHTPSTLLIVDAASSAAGWGWDAHMSGVDYHRVDISWNRHWGSGVWSRMSEVKGLEFQHVLIALSLPAFVEMDLGFAGTGRTNYLGRRLARIPFSRAKDSLVTLCAGPTDLTREYLRARPALFRATRQYGIVDVYKTAPVLQKILAGEAI